MRLNLLYGDYKIQQGVVVWTKTGDPYSNLWRRHGGLEIVINLTRGTIKVPDIYKGIWQGYFTTKNPCNPWAVVQRLASLLQDLKYVSSNPTKVRMKLPCFHSQFTITMEIVTMGGCINL